MLDWSCGNCTNHCCGAEDKYDTECPAYTVSPRIVSHPPADDGFGGMSDKVSDPGTRKHQDTTPGTARSRREAHHPDDMPQYPVELREATKPQEPEPKGPLHGCGCCPNPLLGRPTDMDILGRRSWCCFCWYCGGGWHNKLDPAACAFNCLCCRQSCETADWIDHRDGTCSTINECCCCATVGQWPPVPISRVICCNTWCCGWRSEKEAVPPGKRLDIEALGETFFILLNRMVACYCCCCACTEGGELRLCRERLKCPGCVCDGNIGLPIEPYCRCLCTCLQPYVYCRLPELSGAPIFACCGWTVYHTHMEATIRRNMRLPRWCEYCRCTCLDRFCYWRWCCCCCGASLPPRQQEMR